MLPGLPPLLFYRPWLTPFFTPAVRAVACHGLLLTSLLALLGGVYAQQPAQSAAAPLSASPTLDLAEPPARQSFALPLSGPATGSKNNQPLQIKADVQTYDAQLGQSRFTGHVRVDYDHLIIEGTEATVSMPQAAEGEAQKPTIARFLHRPLLRRSVPQKGQDLLQGDLLEVNLTDNRFAATGNVVSDLHTLAAAPIQVKSDVQQFDNNTRQISALGNVNVAYEQLRVTSQKAFVKLNPAGGADRVLFLGSVKLKQKDSQVAANQITVLPKTNNLIAEGSVVTTVEAPADSGKGSSTIILKSAYQQFDQAAHVILASGSVRLVYEDYVVTGPKATFYLKPAKGASAGATAGGGSFDVDHVLLTGRPTIVAGERTVTANTIVLNTAPRRFDARGNVKTLFKTQASAAKKPVTPLAAAGKANKPLKPAKKPAKPLPKTEEDEFNLNPKL